jgi:hypothetical protein
MDSTPIISIKDYRVIPESDRERLGLYLTALGNNIPMIRVNSQLTNIKVLDNKRGRLHDVSLQAKLAVDSCWEETGISNPSFMFKVFSYKAEYTKLRVQSHQIGSMSVLQAMNRRLG